MAGRHITHQQERIFMAEREENSVAVAAARAGISRASGYRLLKEGRREGKPRGRRRPDPLAGVFESEVVPKLEASPDLRPVAVFHELMRTHPELDPGIRRTLERRIRAWRAEHGPEKEVRFRQVAEAGRQVAEAGRQGLADFTSMNGLGVEVEREPLAHRLFHFRLAWSGFAHAEVVVGGESCTALAEGLQNALEELGGSPRELRTDSLSAAFRNVARKDGEDLTRRYRLLCEHYGMRATRNNRGRAHENGAIEGSHGHLKRELADALALRGSKEFENLAAYREFVAEVVGRANARRTTRIEAERRALRALANGRCGEGEEIHSILKRDLSGGMMPSRKFGANACWWELTALSHNLLALLRVCGLGKAWLRVRMKRLRAVFIRVVRRARREKLVIRGTGMEPFREAFERLAALPLRC